MDSASSSSSSTLVGFLSQEREMTVLRHESVEGKEKQAEKKRKSKQKRQKIEGWKEQEVPATAAATAISSPKEKPKKSKEKRKNRGERSTSKSGPARKKTMYVAVQISNPEVHRNLWHLQEEIAGNKPELRSCLTPLSKAHVTLMALSAEKEQCGEILDALETAVEVLEDQPLHLHFEGIGNVKKMIYYAKVAEDEELERLQLLYHSIAIELGKLGVCQPNGKDFRPHLTFVKAGLTKKSMKFGKPFEIGPVDENRDFGTQTVTDVQLLSASPKSGNSYYPLSGSVRFSSTAGIIPESTDHDLCCNAKRPERVKPRKTEVKVREQNSGAVKTKTNGDDDSGQEAASVTKRVLEGIRRNPQTLVLFCTVAVASFVYARKK